MIIKIMPDKERAMSIFNLAKSTELALNEITQKIIIGENQSLVVREYYEIIRELITAVMLCEGLKATGENAHKETINYLSKCEDFSHDEILMIQDLRIRRNNSAYEGKPIKSPYLENKKDKLDSVIGKLKKILEKRVR